MGVQPIILRAGDYSPQLRNRYIWSNRPNKPLPPLVESTLQDCLIGANRRAIQTKIATITSNLNSLRQGKEQFFLNLYLTQHHYCEFNSYFAQIINKYHNFLNIL